MEHLKNRRKFTTQEHLAGLLRRGQQTTASCGTFNMLLWDRVLLVRRPLFGLLYQTRMNDDECGAVGGMNCRGNQSIRGKPSQVPLCPPQIPHDLTRARTWANAVGSQRLTA
jgi:hypothetical protein